MVVRLAGAALFFLLALHEYFRGVLEGAENHGEGFVTLLLAGDSLAGPFLLVCVGLFLVYRAWGIRRDHPNNQNRRS